MIEAIYITDSTDKLVFQHLKSLASPSFSSLEHVIQFRDPREFNLSSFMTTGSTANTHSSATETTLPTLEVNSEYFITYDKLDGLLLYVLCSYKNYPNPMIASDFIERFLAVLTEYFTTPVTANKISSSSDTLVLLLNEMLHGDTPYITDPNQLKDVIPNKTLLAKILSTGSSLASAATSKSANSFKPAKEESNIPWRRSNVKYTNNEMYVDIVESVNVILKPTKKTGDTQFDSGYYSTSRNASGSKLVPITGEVIGQVNFKSRLSGVPMLQLILKSVDFGLPSFHQCINIDKWLGHPGTLSFIPADGESVLMDYAVEIDPKSVDLLGLVDIDFQTGLGDHHNEFEVKLYVKSHPAVSKIENLSIEIVCENNEQEEDEIRDFDDDELNDIEDESKRIITGVKTKRITHGDFRYLGKGKSEWLLNSIKTGILATLHGSISTNETLDLNSKSNSAEDLIEIKETKKLKPLYLKVNYSYKGAVPSGVKVESLNILSAKGLGETVKPYKGVKYITKAGYYVVRS